MRSISFSLTTDQVRDRTKTVTRRLRWKNLKPGTLLQGVVKAMGLKKGERQEKLEVIRVLSVRQEPLTALILKPVYGREETTKEGFPEGHPLHEPAAFVQMFCEHNRCEPDEVITRIEFDYPEVNLAHAFALKGYKNLDEAREDFDGGCIDFAGDFVDSLRPKARLAYFETPLNSRWRYHAALELDGWIHDLWADRAMPLDAFMARIGATEVDYPAEGEE